MRADPALAPLENLAVATALPWLWGVRLFKPPAWGSLSPSNGASLSITRKRKAGLVRPPHFVLLRITSPGPQNLQYDGSLPKEEIYVHRMYRSTRKGL